MQGGLESDKNFMKVFVLAFVSLGCLAVAGLAIRWFFHNVNVVPGGFVG